MVVTIARTLFSNMFLFEYEAFNLWFAVVTFTAPRQTWCQAIYMNLSVLGRLDKRLRPYLHEYGFNKQISTNHDPGLFLNDHDRSVFVSQHSCRYGLSDPYQLYFDPMCFCLANKIPVFQCVLAGFTLTRIWLL